MLSPTRFRDLVSGGRKGIVAALLRGGLRLLEIPYTLAMTVRNRRYDRGRAQIVRAGVPVWSVGNLTLGGTGKTPLVAWLCRWLRARDVRVAIVSRGYGATHEGRNDEALELESQLPDVPHVQNADRAAAARVAVEELESEWIVLDDGFQHRRLARAVDIVLLDALEPFGFGHVFPRGTLREPLAGLARADVVALSRSDVIEPPAREAIRAEVARLAPRAVWCEVVHAPRELLAADGGTAPLADLAGRPLAAFCGIGNPAGFRHTLQQCGYEIAAFRELPDHHAYGRSDVESLAHWAREAGAAAFVCTQKDLVKLRVDRLGGLPLWAVAIGLEVTAGQEALEHYLAAALGRDIARPA